MTQTVGPKQHELSGVCKLKLTANVPTFLNKGIIVSYLSHLLVMELFPETYRVV